MNSFFDAFISYGRADSLPFAKKLQARLAEQDLNAWFDKNNIPLGVDFQNQIDDGIEKAHNFLFIISPHSINSEYCCQEIELAIKLNKRIIPLMHVEKITQNIWQQRNPNKTIEEWYKYQEQGKHDSYRNMHPLIGKINWVWFREGTDNFEKSLADLVELLREDSDYVERHSRFLTKALEWKRNHKQTNYLLISEELKQAEAWLKRRFQDKQPPCIPTDLHCEFITESIKNANNLMTQVFLSYSDKNREDMHKIRNSLMKEGITVWMNQTDIKTGEAFDNAINRGIEQADNVVYLLSPDSLISQYSQKELEYAFSLNKRIIPILVKKTNPLEIPAALRELHYIDLTDNVKEQDYHLDKSQLLKILYQDEAYYKEHKILLVKALKWGQQNKNSSILLRGYNLRHAELWLEVAKLKKQHPPIPLVEEFIQESLQQQTTDSAIEVFISYSRADSDLARKLNEALQLKGKTTWFDQESIASGADFEQEINRGIEDSNNFLFIISPKSVNSPYCAKEVEYAQKLNKRFVTVLHKSVSSAELHPALAKIQWIDFNQNDGDFDINFSELFRTLETDREHVHSHTKLSQKALAWTQKNKSTDLLLRGSEFTIAESWLQETEQQNKQPAATLLQKDYIAASRDAIAADTQKEKRRVVLLKSLLALVSLGFLISASVGGFAFVQARKAKVGEIESLAASSEAQLALGKQFEALLIGLRAAQKFKQARFIHNHGELKATVVTALQQPLSQVKERNRLEGHQAAINDLEFSPDGQIIATTSDDKTVKLWESNGKKIKALEEHNNEVLEVEFSPDGETIATGSKDKTVKLWHRDGTLLQTLKGHKGRIHDVEFSPDGKTIATASANEDPQKNEDKDNTVKLWRLDGTLIVTLKRHTDGVNDVEFSPDGKIIATASKDKTVTLWDLNGKLLYTLKGHNAEINDINFSPDGKIIATASNDEKVMLWDREKGIRRLTLESHSGSINHVRFSPDGKIIVTVSADKTIKLWDANGKLLHSLEGHNELVNSINFSPDGKTIATTSDDKKIILWHPDGTRIATLTGHNNRVSDARFSPDGKTIASVSGDRTVKLWDLENPLMTRLPREQNEQNDDDSLTPIVVSPTGKTFVTISKEQSVQLWQADGTEIKTLVEKGECCYAEFSRDGRTLATIVKHNMTDEPAIVTNEQSTIPENQSSSKVFSLKLWKADGTLITTLVNKTSQDLCQRFSALDPDLGGQPISDLDPDLSGRFIPDLDELELVIPDLGGRFIPSLQFSPDGQTLVTIEDNGATKLWKADDGTLITTLIEKSKHYPGVYFSPDDKFLVTTEHHGASKLWKTNGTAIPTPIEQKHNEGWTRVKFSPDSQTFLTWNEAKTSYGPLQLWKTNGTLVATLIEKSERGNQDRDGEFERVEASFSSDGQTLVTAINDGTSSILVKLWNANGNSIATLEKEDDERENLVDVDFPENTQISEAFYSKKSISQSKDGVMVSALSKDRAVQNGDALQILVTKRKDGQVNVWHADGKHITKLAENSSEEEVDVKPSPDGQTFVTRHHQKGVTLWNANGSPSPIKTLLEHDEETNEFVNIRVKYSPDSQIIAVVDQKDVTLWDQDGRKIDSFTHEADVNLDLVKFSPDSKIFASASMDNRVKLWTRSNKITTTISDYTDRITHLEFSPDSKILISASETEIISRRLERITNLNKLFKEGCQRVADYIKTSSGSDSDSDFDSICEHRLHR